MKARLYLSMRLPGSLLCASVAILAWGAERAEAAIFGKAWIESLVLAILIGMAVRTMWRPGPTFASGIRYSAKTLLEAAVVLMGATVNFQALVASGAPLIAAVIVTVMIAIAASFMLGRIFGLNTKMSMLVACGNGICGNSAIAAVAPVIEADSDDVATAIAFTAVLGIGVVLLIPPIAGVLQLSAYAGGILAGLTVYAVPQVLAAAGPLGTVAVQVGTLVKLVRVLMLGPIVTCLAIFRRRAVDAEHRPSTFSVTGFLPAFIVAFLLLATIRSLNLLPADVARPAGIASHVLTVIAMAGLGLEVDLRSVFVAGPRVTTVVTLSLLGLGTIALAALHIIGLAA